jgi:hypothetical protein
LNRNSNKKAELPKVYSSAARPSSQKTRRFPPLPHERFGFVVSAFIDNFFIKKRRICQSNNWISHLRIKSAPFFMDLKFKSAHLMCLELAMVRAPNVTKQSHD